MLDAPLLFETRILEHVCFPIITVAIMDEDKLRRRLMDRDKSSREEAQNRINAQWPLKSKVEKADIVVDNSGTVKELEEKVLNELIPAIFEMLDYDKNGFIKEDTD